MLRFGAAWLLSMVLVTGCMSPSGNTAEEKRQAILQMRSETLAELYEVHPEAKAQIDQAVGYGVLSNVGVNLIILSTVSGYGIVRDKGARTDTYMKMYSAGIGPGIGVKAYRGVFVFTTREALESFLDDGWDASAQADAAAKSGDKGGAWAGSVDVAPGIRLCQLTQHGLALQATIQGTKFWKDDELG